MMPSSVIFRGEVVAVSFIPLAEKIRRSIKSCADGCRQNANAAHNARRLRHTVPEVRHVSRKRAKRRMDALSLDREQRVCPEYDSTGIRKTEVAEPGDVGMRVVDDCAEEHIM